MGLSTADLAALATDGAAMLGSRMEAITYYAKSTPTATAVVYAGVMAALEEFRLHELGAAIGASELQLRDRRARIATSAVIWAITPHDELTRADGTLWRVLASSEGTERPWTFLTLRQVG